MSGGGGTSQPTSQTVTQTNIPEYARPYAESMLGQGQALTDTTQNPFQFYDAQRFSGFSPMQAQAFQNISGQQVAPQLADASNLAYTGASQGLGVQQTAQGLQQTALGYGQAGAGYGGAASTLGMTGAQQALMDSQRAQQQAQMYGGMGAQAGQVGMGYGGMGAGFGEQAAGFGALGAQQAGQVAGQAGASAGQLGQMATGFGAQGAQQAAMDAQRAQQFAQMYGGMGAQAGMQGLTSAQQAQRAAEGQADIYGQMGAGFGAQAAGMSPQAQQYGQSAADIGMAGLGFGTMGAGIGGRGVSAAEQGFGAGQQYAQQATSPSSMQAYMSPYMQNVVDQQQREATRQSEIQRQGIQSQAAQQGAFGGSRSAIVEAERQRNLSTQLGDIQGAGLQRAFEQAQQAQQFGAGLGIQGLQAGLQGLQTGMQGTAQGMQGAQTGIAGQQAGLSGLGQAGQLFGLGMQGAGLGLQGTGQRLAAGQLGLQGAQTGIQGAGMGLQGVGQQLAGGQLGLSGAQTGIAGTQAGLQGVGQQLAAGQLGLAGTGQGIQGAQAGIQGAQAGMQGAQTGIQGAQAGLQGVGQQLAGGQLGLSGVQTGIQGQQAGMQGAQTGLQGVGQATGAGQYGLAGSQLGIQGAGALGQLGQTQYGQEMGITDAMQKYGALQQQQQQQNLDFQYQQFLAQQQYPYQQLGFMSDLLRGVPSNQSAMYQTQAQPAMAPQLLGAGLAAYGALGRKEGGQIKKYREGGQVEGYQEGGNVSPVAMQTMAVQEMPSKLRRLSDSQLAAYARSVKDAITLSAIQSELQRRERTRMPGGEPPEVTTAESIAKRAEQATIGEPMVGMAGGGIVALNAGGPPMMQPGMLPPVQEPPSRDLFNQIPTGIAPPAPPVPPAPPEAPVAPPVSGIAAAGQAQQTPPPAPALAPAEAPQAEPVPPLSQMSFAQWKEMSQSSGISPEDQSVLDDMKLRVDSRMARAEKSEDTAKYDAMLMAGLAMMGGRSLAEGIAMGAQTGGATFLAGKENARKAIDAAEDAELAFSKYQMELRRGDEKAAREEFNAYSNQMTKLYEIDTRREVGMAQAGATRESTLWQRVESAVANDRRVRSAEEAIKSSTTDVQRATATQAFNSILAQVRREKEAQFGVTAPTTEAGPPPVPSSKDQLKSGTVYNTARGPARWNGERFEPVQ